MPTPDATLPPRLRARLDRWLTRWGTSSLRRTLRIEYSPRLRRAFGRCYQQERLIRLTPSLRDTQSFLLAEIVCHEAAHAAVYEIHGPAAKPHGAEWEELMRMAGFEPRVRIPVVVRSAPPRAARERPLYLHRCPVCDRSRRASRPMHQWRCRTCSESGREGRLVIRRDESTRTVRRQAGTSASRQRKKAAASNGSASGTGGASIKGSAVGRPGTAGSRNRGRKSGATRRRNR